MVNATAWPLPSIRPKARKRVSIINPLIGDNDRLIIEPAKARQGQAMLGKVLDILVRVELDAH